MYFPTQLSCVRVSPAHLILHFEMKNKVAFNFSKRVMTLTGDMMEFKMGPWLVQLHQFRQLLPQLSEGASASTDTSGTICHTASTNSA